MSTLGDEAPEMAVLGVALPCADRSAGRHCVRCGSALALAAVLGAVLAVQLVVLRRPISTGFPIHVDNNNMSSIPPDSQIYI